MSYSDDFLVQKLKEILLKLYPTPSQSSPSSSLGSSPSRSNPNSHAKFPKLFLSLQESEDEANNIFQKPTSSFGQDHVFHSSSNNGKIETGTGHYGTGHYYGRDEASLLNTNTSTFLSSLELFEDDNNQEFVGIVHNVSSFDRVGYKNGNGNESLILGKVNSVSPNRDSYETALNRNLHEFIQVLKMSFGPDGGGGAGVWKNEEGSGNLNPMTREVGGGGGGTRAEFGLSSNDLEFNLTLDDIMDLNMLLDGSENVLQFKHVLIISLYFFIAVVSIVGNLLVVQLVIRSRRLHTLTHALLANLAVADLLMATLNIPFSAARVILAEWPFGKVLCHLVPFIQVTSVYVTSGTMAVIAIDRYSVIMNPLGTRMKSSHGVLLVFAIWLVSGVLSLPYAIHHKVVRVLTTRVVNRCQAEFSNESRRWLTVGTFLAQYLLPLLFTTVSYLSIMQRLRQRSTDGLGSTTPRQVAAQSRAKKKTIKMLQITVLFFAVSWAPINSYHLLTHFSLVRHNSTAILICHLIAMSSCTVNPFIYCWFNDHFRREALKWMRCFRPRRCPAVHPHGGGGGDEQMNGMLTRGTDRTAPTQSTTFVSTSLRSPRLLQEGPPPRTTTHQTLLGHLVVRNNNHQAQQSPSPTTSHSHSHIFTNGNSPSLSPASSSHHLSINKKSRFIGHSLSSTHQQQNYNFADRNKRRTTRNADSPIEIEVRYCKERPESLFLIRNQSYEDIFTGALITTSKFNQEESDLEQVKKEVGGDEYSAKSRKNDEDEEEDDEIGDYSEDCVLKCQKNEGHQACLLLQEDILEEFRNYEIIDAEVEHDDSN